MYSKEIKNIVQEMLEASNFNAWTRTNKNKPKLNELIKSTSFLDENSTIKERIYCVQNNIFDLISCSSCNKQVKFNWGQNQYSKYCVRCSQLIPETKKKRKITILKKYGVEHYAQAKECHDKMKQTSLKRYGVENYAQTKECQEKIKQTTLKRYGVENYAQTKEYKKKIKKTNLKRYGVENYSKTDEYKKRVKQTSLEKYGVTNYTQTSEYNKKTKQTSLKRYGVEHYSKTKECQEKIKQTTLEKYGVEHYSQTKEYYEQVQKTSLERYGVEHYSQTKECLDKMKQTTLERYGVEYSSQKHISQEILDKLNNKDWLYKEHVIKEKPLIQISNELNLSPTIASRYLKKHNIEAQYFKTSLEEKELQEYISSLTSNVITNTRSVISPLELDIYLPDYQLAFEYNGLYWHSHSVKQNKFYHVNKTNLCNDKHIRLTHIFEHEWLFKQDIIKSKINSLLDVNKKINVNKCQIKEIDYEQSKIFLDRTHIQGNATSEIQIGLFYKNKPMSVMTFNKFNNEYELLRFGSELNMNVIDAESILFNYFIEVYKPKSIISYNDLRYGNDDIYNNLGFKFSHIIGPDYFYFKEHEIITKNQCQKHKLLEEYDSDLTEYQNMLNNGYDKIYNCGNSIFLKILTQY